MPHATTLLRSTVRTLAAVATLYLGSAHASSLPDPVLQQDYGLQRVGAGELSWLGRPIYQASLWTHDGRYSGFVPGQPVALSLWYQREFSRDELLRITSTAWRLLGSVPAAQRERWLESLRGMWSGVEPGDNVTTVVVPGGATRFYSQRGQFGQVDDPAFGPAFLAIWLDDRTVVSDLRAELLGLGRSRAARQ